MRALHRNNNFVCPDCFLQLVACSGQKGSTSSGCRWPSCPRWFTTLNAFSRSPLFSFAVNTSPTFTLKRHLVFSKASTQTFALTGKLVILVHVQRAIFLAKNGRLILSSPWGSVYRFLYSIF